MKKLVYAKEAHLTIDGVKVMKITPSHVGPLDVKRRPFKTDFKNTPTMVKVAKGKRL